MAKKAKQILCTRCGEVILQRDNTQEVCLCERCAAELETEYIEEIEKLGNRLDKETEKGRRLSLIQKIIAVAALIAVLAGGLATAIYAIIS